MKFNKDAIRWLHTLETFAVVFIVTLFSQISIAGNAVDLGSKEGQAVFVSALASAGYLALRRALGTVNGTTPAK
jgi:hypothetical protein